MVKKIHFICRGNVFRSLTAETYLRSLNLPGIVVTSSGVNVDILNPVERGYFANTLTLLKNHHIDIYAKKSPDQLTQERVDNQDITICMNQRVLEEAKAIVVLPANTEVWGVIDIGEGNRTVITNRLIYEEEIYQEITSKIGKLVDGIFQLITVTD